MTRTSLPNWLGCGLLMAAPLSLAATLDDCINQELTRAPADATIASIKARCQSLQQLADIALPKLDKACLAKQVKNAADTALAGDLVEACQSDAKQQNMFLERIAAERATENNPFVLTPHRLNYILPYSYNNNPNQQAYSAGGESAPIDNAEAKLQISVKVPLNYGDLFTTSDGIYFGFTLKSFWQVYNHEISAPFRETNYRPEVFYQAPLPFKSGNGMWLGRVGLEHESNGRTQLLSRSWNRAYVAVGYAADNWLLSIQPWYRFPEDAKPETQPGQPPASKGDDNPDIQDYMGHFEMNGAYKYKKVEFTGMFRRNFSTSKGAHEIGMTFPLWGRLKGYAQYFDGYGESLIDYNNKNQRLGIGFLLTDAL